MTAVNSLRPVQNWDGPGTLAATKGTGAVMEAKGLQFRAHQGLKGLEQLDGVWQILAQSIPGAGFNHFPGWYRAYLVSAACDPANVWFVAAYRGEEVVGIFPLQFQKRQVSFVRPRFLGTIDDDELQLSDFVFAPSPQNAGLLDELTRWLRRESTLPWHVLRLLKIPDDAALAYAVRAQSPKLTVAIRYDASAYFDTSGSYEHATRAMTSKMRSNLRRRARLAEGAGALRFQSCQRQEELAQAFETFLEIEASGWKGPTGSSSAIRCRPRVLAFYSEMVREFAARDECVINLLWHGEQAIAAQLGLKIGRTLHILKVGYRDDNPAFAAGILLQDQTIRYACDHPQIDVISMVNNPYWARSFKPETRAVWLYYMPNWNARGLLAYLGILLKRTIDECSARVRALAKKSSAKV
jgi:CelD/BcsL family acetyltransferase involved in cellulose biosynthesis